MDRPDRSAWITAQNRCALVDLIGVLDRVLRPSRPGGFVGRVYVDGLDIEAPVDKIPALPGASVRRAGGACRVYRAGAVVYDTDAASPVVDHGVAKTEMDLRVLLRRGADPEGGPLAGGRAWPALESDDPFFDPRDLPDQASEPLHVDEGFGTALGFLDPVDPWQEG